MNPTAIEEVKRQAMYRWKDIFLALAPQLQEAIEKAGRHVPCPVHGGVDGFRLFNHYEMKGDGICNTCGHRSDGFEMLMWLNHWSFPQAVREVGKFLGIGGLLDSTIQPPAKEEVHSGRIQMMSYAPFHDNPSNAKSYKLVLLTEDSKIITLWGMGLKNVLERIQAKIGEWVTVKRVGKKAIQIDSKSFNKTIWSAFKVESPQQKQAKELALKAQQVKSAEKKMNAIRKVWHESLSLTAHAECVQAARRYLMRRFIWPSADRKLESVAVHPGLFYTEAGQILGTYPALICRVTDPNGQLVTLHRTYLMGNGFKAKVPSPKKLMSVPDGKTINGASIRLAPAQEVLAIAEGVETALSVMRLTGLPCWSVISANGMRSFQAPQGVKEVHIFADLDISGEGRRAANDLHARLTEEGIKSVIHMPDLPIPANAKGIDFNDVLIQKLL